ncbi:BQ5605_C015g07934 [Microbotryum silenes-dioicae]|uniref:BQ5605_C015g07934 protein n=1 Tax=Microbotryum silenes-dioicae TaxID=796604 RepID=A0A2X0MMY3_9BASI|nr:BQ5605_C015g07934 [Microbotryum silenes-dioicae]
MTSGGGSNSTPTVPLPAPMRSDTSSCTPRSAMSTTLTPGSAQGDNVSTTNTIRTVEEAQGTSASEPGTVQQELPPQDRGWRAWRFVLASCLLDLFVSSGQTSSQEGVQSVANYPTPLQIWGGTFAYGTWLEYYLSHPPFQNESPVSLGAVGTVALALNYAEMLIGIILCGKYPHHIRKGMWACLVVYSGSLLIASFARQGLIRHILRQLWTLMFFQGVLAGSAGGLLYAPIYVWLSQWFQARRALAGGTIFAGAGVGGFAFPLILNALLPPLGFRWTLRLFALITLIICGLSVHLLQPRLPSVRPPPKCLPSSSLAPNQLQARQDHASASEISFSILYDPSFLLVSGTVLTQGMMFSPILTYLPTYLTSFESPTLASLTLALLNAATIPGLIMTGHLCDRYPYTWVQAVSTLLATLSIFLLLRVGDTFSKTLIFALLIGVSAGGFASTWFPSSIDVATCTGRKKDASQSAVVFGYLAIVRGVASIVGPVIAGSVYKPTRVEGGERMGKFGLGSFVVLSGTLGVVALGFVLGNEMYRRWRRGLSMRREAEGDGKELKELK